DCSPAGNRPLGESHLSANLLLGPVAGLLQCSLQLLLVRWITGFAQARQEGKITVNLLNRHVAVVRLYDAQLLTLLPIGRQRFQRADSALTDYGLDHGLVLENRLATSYSTGQRHCLPRLCLDGFVEHRRKVIGGLAKPLQPGRRTVERVVDLAAGCFA